MSNYVTQTTQIQTMCYLWRVSVYEMQIWINSYKIRNGWYLQVHMIVNGCSYKSWKVIIHWYKKKYANISWIQITMYICDVSQKNGMNMWTKLETKYKSEMNHVLDEVEK